MTRHELALILESSGLTIAGHSVVGWTDDGVAIQATHKVTFRLRNYVSEKYAFMQWLKLHGGIIVGYDYDFVLLADGDESYIYPVARWITTEEKSCNP